MRRGSAENLGTALGTAVVGALAGATVLRAVENAAAGWFLPRYLEAGGAGRSGRRAVLVLGHADTGTTAGPENLARTCSALDVARPGDVLVLSGGGVAGAVPEARLLADAARDLGWNGEIRLEEHSGSTWENIENSARLLEDADRIVIVSEPVHAAKARRFLALQRPELAARLLPTTTPDGEEPLPRAGAWGVLMGLIDLWLSEHVDGWAQDSAQGLAGVRRLVASRG